MISVRILCATLLTMLAAEPAGAGAWTRAQGEGFTSQSFRYFSTELSTSSDVDFAQSTVNGYIEYGLLDTLTVGLETDQSLRLDQDGYGQQSGRVGGFVRVRLWDGGADGVASVQIGGSRPITAVRSAAAPGGDDSNEFKGLLQYGRGFETRFGAAWIDGAAGFAHFTGGRADELKLELTAGLRPDENWVAMAQVFVTKGRRNAAFGAPDFDVTKLKASVGRRIFGERTLLIGLQRDVLSRGLSPGWEASLTLWSEF